MAGRRNRAQHRRRQRRDRQAEPQPGQHQVGVEAGQGQRAEPVPRGEDVHGPAGHQCVRHAGERQPAGRHPPLAEPGHQQPAERRPGGERDQEPGQQQRAPDRVSAEQGLRQQLHIHQGHHQGGPGEQTRGEDRHQAQAGPPPAPHQVPGERDRARDHRRRTPRRQYAALGIRVVQAHHEQPECHRDQYAPGQVDGLAAPVGACRYRPVHRDRGEHGERYVHPEHPPPADQRGQARAVQRAQYAAGLLRRAERAEGNRPLPLGEHVRGQRQRHRQQGAAGQPLQATPGDQQRQRRAERGERRTGGEAGQAGVHHRPAPEPVGEPAQQRHAGDVAEQVAGDQRGGPFQVVHRDVQVGHDLDEQRDHDVRVQRGEQDGGATDPDRQAPTAHRWSRAHRSPKPAPSPWPDRHRRRPARGTSPGATRGGRRPPRPHPTRRPRCPAPVC